MTKACARMMLCALVTVACCVPTTEAVTRQRDKQLRKEKKEHKKEPWTPPPNRSAFVLKFTGGQIVGDAAKAIGGRFNEKVVAGVGVGYEYSIRPRLALGLNLGILWGNFLGRSSDPDKIHAFSYSGSWLLRLSPQSRSSLFLRSEAGFVTPKYEDWKLRTLPFFRIGLGELYATSKKMTGRFEFFYEALFCKNYEIKNADGYNIGTIHFTGTGIGLEGTLGFWF